MAKTQRQPRGVWRVFKKDPTRSKYTIEGRDHLHVKRRMQAFRDKSLSEELARNVATIVDHKRQNAPLPPLLAAWVQDLAPDLKDRQSHWRDSSPFFRVARLASKPCGSHG